MRQKKQPYKKLVAVRINPHLDREVERFCKRNGYMKMDFFTLALRDLLQSMKERAA